MFLGSNKWHFSHFKLYSAPVRLGCRHTWCLPFACLQWLHRLGMFRSELELRKDKSLFCGTLEPFDSCLLDGLSLNGFFESDIGLATYSKPLTLL